MLLALCMQHDERLGLIDTAFPGSGGGTAHGVCEKQENRFQHESSPWAGSSQCM